MKASLCVAALACAIACMCSTAVALPVQLQSGDTLVYAVTLELQQHNVQRAPQPEQSSEASGQGTETLHVYNIGADGTAYARVDAAFQGMQDGKPVELRGNSLAKVLPDGQIRLQGGLDRSIIEALNFANAITREVSTRSLAVGQSWKSVLTTQFVSLTVTRRVTGRKRYHGLPAAVIESTASGSLKNSSDGGNATGTVTISGTSYYDDRDRLLVGESIRIFSVLRASGQRQAHINYSAAVNVVLSSLTRESAPRRGPALPGQTPPPQASAVPATAAPTATPMGNGPSPAATVTPRPGY